jgi:hypothetical protein
MESVGILRVLWRRRVAVALGCLLAAVVGALAMDRASPAPSFFQGSAPSSYALQRVLVDTPQSLVVDARPKGAASIGPRAVLLGALLASDEAKAAIARDVGLRPSAIAVVGPGAAAPQVVTPLAEQATEVAHPREPYVVTVSEDPNLPILSILATAPGPRQARTLAEAGADALGSLARQAPIAGGEMAIKPLGHPEVGAMTAGAANLKAAAAAIAILVLWCCAVVVFDGFARNYLPFARVGSISAMITAHRRSRPAARS